MCPFALIDHQAPAARARSTLRLLGEFAVRRIDFDFNDQARR
jgi:hypothetical protein